MRRYAEDTAVPISRAKLLALGNLVRRMRAVRKHAWHEREEMDRALELAFVALERIERLARGAKR